MGFQIRIRNDACDVELIDDGDGLRVNVEVKPLMTLEQLYQLHRATENVIEAFEQSDSGRAYRVP